MDKSVIEIISNLVYQEQEYCGNFETDKYLISNIVKGSTIDQRKQCVTHNSKYMWHTHPVGSYFYPSGDDIYKVYKNPKILESYVFGLYNDKLVYSKIYRISNSLPNVDPKYADYMKTKIDWEFKKVRLANGSLSDYINVILNTKFSKLNYQLSDILRMNIHFA